MVHAGPDKVHIDTRFTRYRKDGSVIGGFDSIYVVNRENGKVGREDQVQLRALGRQEVGHGKHGKSTEIAKPGDALIQIVDRAKSDQ